MKKLALLLICLFVLLFSSCSETAVESVSSDQVSPSSVYSVSVPMKDDFEDDSDGHDFSAEDIQVSSSAVASCEVVNSSLRQYSIDTISPYVIFAAEIKNTGSCDLIFASDSSVDFLSADGMIVYTEKYISIQPDVVSPGESAYVSVCTNAVLDSSEQSRIASCVLHTYYDSLRTDYQKPDISFSNISVSNIYDYPNVIAQAKNNTSDFQDVFVATAVFDESGVIVDVQIGGTSLASGEEKGFSQSGIAYVQDTSGYTASLVPYTGMFAFSSDFSEPSALQYTVGMDTSFLSSEPDEFMSWFNEKLSDSSFTDYSIEISGNIVDAKIIDKQAGFVAILAASGMSSYEAEWRDVVSSFLNLSETMQDMFDLIGSVGNSLQFSLVSDDGLTLLTSNNGVLTYDCVQDVIPVAEPTSVDPSNAPDSSVEPVSPDLPAFNGLKFSGTGDSVITDIDLPIGAIYYAYISYSGSRNFIVKVYDDSGSYDLAVNEIGNYRGFYLFIYDSVSRIEITACSAWEISIAQLTFPENSNEITNLSGSGAYVSYIFDAPSGVWNFTHDGSRNFIVYAYQTDGTKVSKRSRSLLVNEIGAYSGDHFIDTSNGDHIVFVIEADGNWTASMVE